MSFSFEVIKEDNNFKSLIKIWQDIFQKCSPKTPFQSPVWNYYYWKFVLNKKDLYLILIKADSKIIGLAPLVTNKIRILGINIKVLKLMTSGPSEENDLVILPEYQNENLFNDLFRFLNKRLSHDFDLILFEDISKNAYLFKYFHDKKKSKLPKRFITPSFICPLLDFKNNISNLINTKDKTYQRQIKKISQLGQFEYKFTLDQNLIKNQIDEILFLHSQQWSQKKDTSNFLTSSYQSFLNSLLQDNLFKGKIFNAYLSLNNKMIAFNLGFIEGKNIYTHRAAYSQDLFLYSPGNLLNKNIIKNAIDLGYETMNHGRGEHEYKLLISNRFSTTFNIIIFSLKIRSRFLSSYLFYYFRLKFFLRKYKFFKQYTIFGYKFFLKKFFPKVKVEKLTWLKSDFKTKHLPKDNKKFKIYLLPNENLLPMLDSYNYIDRKTFLNNTFRNNKLFVIEKSDKILGIFWLRQSSYHSNNLDYNVKFEKNEFCLFDFCPANIMNDSVLVSNLILSLRKSLKNHRLDNIYVILKNTNKKILDNFKKNGFISINSSISFKIFNLRAIGYLPYGRYYQ